MLVSEVPEEASSVPESHKVASDDKWKKKMPKQSQRKICQELKKRSENAVAFGKSGCVVVDTSTMISAISEKNATDEKTE